MGWPGGGDYVTGQSPQPLNDVSERPEFGSLAFRALNPRGCLSGGRGAR
jgi:hypothetical protein